MSTKNFFQILAVSATALITACEEHLTSFDGETPITVTTRVSEKTRAGYDNSNLPAKFIMDIDQEGDDYDYSNIEMSHSGGNTYTTADNNTFLLWKSNSEHGGANVKAMTIPDGAIVIDPMETIPIAVQLDQTTDEGVKASDLLGAKSGDGINVVGDNIEIEFNHLMTKLYVNYTFADALTSKNPQVNSITLKNTCIKGGYSYNEMNYVGSSLEYGNIQMYHSTANKAAEAIFFPYMPTGTVDTELEVSITINNITKTLSCPVELKDNKSFEGRKKYIMNIRINGTIIDNTSITVVKDWTADNESIETIADKKILWIGTSIPSAVEWFGIDNNYPKMIADATGYNIVNNSRPSSYICYDPICNWTTSAEVEGSFPLGYCLTATRQEIETKYRSVLNRIRGREELDQSWVDNWMNDFLGHSYESLIIPYIDGTKDDCSIIIIDQGYNDRHQIAYECLLNTSGEIPVGKLWLQSLIDNTQSYKECDLGNVSFRSYFVCMDYLIQKCREARPDVKIIIGNYFATRTPVFSAEFTADIGGGECGDLLHMANEAVASRYGFDIVNVYKYTGMDDPTDFTLYYRFCPDGTHPGSDLTGKLNRMIAYAYINELRRIFGETK